MCVWRCVEVCSTQCVPSNQPTYNVSEVNDSVCMGDCVGVCVGVYMWVFGRCVCFCIIHNVFHLINQHTMSLRLMLIIGCM